MTYRYDATPEEEAAAALLREKGWNVAPPACPDCKGFGFVSVGESGDNWGSIGSKACPNGCPPPVLIL